MFLLLEFPAETIGGGRPAWVGSLGGLNGALPLQPFHPLLDEHLGHVADSA